MRQDNRKLDGDLAVDESLEFSGLLGGSIRVVSGGSLRLTGECVGDLSVEPGGHAVIEGTVGGDVINRGIVEIRGAVKGKVASRGGTLIRAPDALIRGVVEQ
ncbi:MAG TPA: hypothetical protein VM491_12215 [Burkholderiaceae bacterium]|jgi:cytoskeletal protein CcmA (bactofilin family)|nr:hypothetical protein [Burkholderiaceae bacterium]